MTFARRAEKSPTLIATHGCIGSGKTTVATRLAAELEATLVLEDFQHLPLIEKFYGDPSTYAYQAEIEFTLTHALTLFNALQAPNDAPVIADFLFEGDRQFAEITLRDKPDRLASYLAVWEALNRLLVTPRFVVLLDAPVEIMLQRIQKRGRPFEQAITKEYLSELRDQILSQGSADPGARVRLVDTSDPEQLAAEIPKIAEEIRAEIETAVSSSAN